MDWTVWVVLGLVLAGIELFLPGGFYLMFFGVAALLVGGLTATVLPANLAVQVLLFTVFSVAGILLFRRALVSKFCRHAPGSEVDAIVGARATALDALAPGGEGKVELRGASWAARNGGGIPIAAGQRCTVERVDGLTLYVRIAAEEYLADTAGPVPRLPAATSPGPAESAGARIAARNPEAASRVH